MRACPVSAATYGGLMPPARITLPQVAISLLIRAANSSGVLATGSKPIAIKRSFMSGSAMMPTIGCRWDQAAQARTVERTNSLG
jgi:hypothetical protein